LKPYWKIILYISISAFIFTFITFFSTVSAPSIISLKITRYGYPLGWFEVVIYTVAKLPPRYTVIPVNLLVDIFFTLILSFPLTFLILNFHSNSNILLEGSIYFKIFFTFSTIYLSRLVSCFVHEVLGHALWAWIFGAEKIWFNISWMGFGWCRWIGVDNAFNAKLMVIAGGIIDTFIIGFLLLIILFKCNVMKVLSAHYILL